MSSDHHFFFASLDSKPPSTARKVHIRRLYDILQLSIQRNDFARAKRAWAILIRCKEFRWEEHWTIGLYILNEGKTMTESIPQRTEYLRAMILRGVDKVSLFCFLSSKAKWMSRKRCSRNSFFFSYYLVNIHKHWMNLNCKSSPKAAISIL